MENKALLNPLLAQYHNTVVLHVTLNKELQQHARAAQEAKHVAASILDLETRARIATSNQKHKCADASVVIAAPLPPPMHTECSHLPYLTAYMHAGNRSCGLCTQAEQ